MSSNNQFPLEYTHLFIAYCTELDCLADALGKIAASECALTEDEHELPALCLPQSVDLDKIVRIAAESLGRKLIKLAERSFSTSGRRPLKINTREFSDHWKACPQKFNPLALWTALQNRFDNHAGRNIVVETKSSASPQSAQL